MDLERTLFVAHAQHPLVEGLYPGPEFTTHLDVTAHFYRTENTVAHGGLTAQIYVPGSRHRGDKRSLSEAGVEYLVGKQRMPEANVHGEDWSRTFGPATGVYHAGAEVHVASRAYHTFCFNRMVAVCSPGQVERLGVHYASYDVLPEFVEASDGRDVHTGTIERTLTFYTQRFNQSWEHGIVPALIRAIRTPRKKEIVVSGS